MARFEEEFDMNEETNIRIVKDGYTNFGSGNITALLENFANDVDWRTPPVTGSPLPHLCFGREEVAKFFAQLEKTEALDSFTPTDFIAQGDRVVVLGETRGKVIPTDRKFETGWVHIFTLRDGKITNFLEYFDTAAMERAYQKATTA